MFSSSLQLMVQRSFPRAAEPATISALQSSAATPAMSVMPVGALTQSVTVQAEVAAIKTDDATVSEVLSTRNVADLPLNGRQPIASLTERGDADGCAQKQKQDDRLNHEWYFLYVPVSMREAIPCSVSMIKTAIGG